MTMNAAASATQPNQGDGASRLRNTIIACKTSDEGACIMCAECGHQFVESNPLTGESQEIDNVTLSKALFSHMCAIGRRQPKRWQSHARKIRH